MGTGDWTIDYWIYPTNLSGVQNHFSGNGNDQLLQLRQSDDDLNFDEINFSKSIHVSRETLSLSNIAYFFKFSSIKLYA